MLSVKKFKLWASVFLCLIVASCTTIECPLGSVTQVSCGIYDTEGKELSLNDTLTVRACGSNEMLLNRAYGIKSFSVPLAYKTGVDTLLLCLSDNMDRAAVDTLFINHDSSPHFESVDCPIVFFHNIVEINSANDSKSIFPITIDRVELVSSIVNYDSDENIRIYLRSISN